MKTTIVRNARIGNNAYSQLHRLKVVNGCISEITEEGSTDTVHSDEINADTIIDVKGRVIFPGMQGNESAALRHNDSNKDMHHRTNILLNCYESTI